MNFCEKYIAVLVALLEERKNALCMQAIKAREENNEFHAEYAEGYIDALNMILDLIR